MRDWFWLIATHRILWVMVGGAVGTLARYLLTGWFDNQPWARSFPPFGTLVINVSGSFILGVVYAIFRERLPLGYQNLYVLFGTGFCGGYTTFSTFELETVRLARDGSWLLVLANVAGSVVAGFLGVLLALLLIGLIYPKR